MFFRSTLAWIDIFLLKVHTINAIVVSVGCDRTLDVHANRFFYARGRPFAFAILCNAANTRRRSSADRTRVRNGSHRLFVCERRDARRRTRASASSSSHFSVLLTRRLRKHRSRRQLLLQSGATRSRRCRPQRQSARPTAVPTRTQSHRRARAPHNLRQRTVIRASANDNARDPAAAAAVAAAAAAATAVAGGGASVCKHVCIFFCSLFASLVQFCCAYKEAAELCRLSFCVDANF